MSIGGSPNAWRRAIREFIYGLTGYEFERHAVELRAELDELFLLLTVGDFIGLPVLPTYYNLRLVPYLLPRLGVWKRRMLRERHLLERGEYDLHQI